jgi:apolipoprotein N-acyltransferase
MTAVETPAAAEPAAPPAPTAPPRVPLRWRYSLPLAVAAGVGLLVAFPPYGLWWLAPVAVGALTFAVHRRGPAGGALLGLLAGLAFFVPLLAWAGINVGSVPWLILACFEGLHVALLGGAAAFASPLVDRYRWLLPPLTGALWVAMEAVRDRVPFGGFPWGRLAFSQADSPLVRLAALGGAPLVSFAVAAAGGLLALGALPPSWRSGYPVGGAVVVVLAGLLVPLGSPGGATVTVAVVQGNVPRLGLDFNAQRRAVLDNHVRATLALAQRVHAGTVRRPDLVVWPENASDIDPLVPGDADAYNEIDAAARAIGAPILLGAVLYGPGDHARNAGIVWDPTTGPGQMYVKQHPVPFAEYMPLRSIARRVSKAADLVTSDFVAGHTPGVLRVGPATVADVICFEVAYDNIVRDAVTGGGQLITVQTNNATFDGAEASQQLAMVRLRAVEYGRDALMASTVGVSAFVDADGTVHDASRFDTAATLVRQVRLGGDRTVAQALGPVPEYLLAALAVLALLGSGMVRRRARPGAVRAGRPADVAADAGGRLAPDK